MSDSARQNDSLLSFGVGCFQLQSKIDLGSNGIDRYIKAIHRFLNKDHLVKEVQFIDETSEEGVGIFTSDNISGHGNITDLKFNYPHFDFASLRFKISIPKRLQKEYLGNFRSPLKSEDFEVDIVYGYESSVAFIRPEYIEENPSTAVTILWKHMRKHWIGDPEIEFCMLGPSPFHADFFVCKSQDDKFHLSYEEEFGYDTVRIFMPSSMVFGEYFDSVVYRLKSNLSLFYSVTKSRNLILSDFSKLVNEINEHLDVEINGVKAFWRKYFSTFESHLSLIRLEKLSSQIQSLDQSAQEYKRYIRQQFGDVILDDKINEQVDDVKGLPIGPYRSILSTLKDRGTSVSANKTALIAAFFGVLLGFALQNGYNFFVVGGSSIF